jgi:hypothetical protein
MSDCETSRSDFDDDLVDPREARRAVDPSFDPILGRLAEVENRRLSALLAARGVEVIYL